MRVWSVVAVGAVAALFVLLVRTCEGEQQPREPDGARPNQRSLDEPLARTRPRAEKSTNPAGPADRGEAAAATSDETTTALVRVVTRDDTAVAGAKVDLHRVRNGPMGYEAPVETSGATGTDGVVRFVVKRGEYFARATSGDEIGGSERSWVPQLPSVAETTLYVALRPAVLHRGRVIVEGTDTPIPAASVHLQDRGVIRETTTDADGRFEFTRVAHNAEPIAWADAFGYVAADRRHVVDDERKITWTITLAPAVVLRGTLRGPDGPLRADEDVGIEIVRDGTEAGGVRISPDAAGRFEATFRGLGELYVRAEGYVLTRLPVECTGPSVLDAGVIELRPGHHLRGRVLDTEGRPVPHVQIRVRNLELAAHGGIEVGGAVTDAAGRFDIDGLDVGELQVDTQEVVKPPLLGGRPETSRRGVHVGTELTIEQPEGNAVLLCLRDPANQALVVPAVRVRIRGPTDTDWQWGLLGQAVHTVRMLARTPGSYDLRVEAEGYEPAERLGVAFPDGRSSQIDVQLVPKSK